MCSGVQWGALEVLQDTLEYSEELQEASSV